MAYGQAGLVKSFFSFMTKLVFTALAGVVLLAGAGFWQYQENLKSPDIAGEGKEIAISVPKGASTSQIAATLQQQGLIKNTLAFRAYARLEGIDGKLKAGEYTLNSAMNVPQIMDKLAKGSVKYISFTIPEGYNTKQIVGVLAEKNLINRDKFTDLVVNGSFDYDFLAGLPNNEKRLEGYLFPDTYKITPNTSEQQIIVMMLDRFNKEITPEYRNKAQALGLSLHQAVILASIVEREAKVDAERPKVAAVFLNRIKKGWKLESCATVQYALGQQKARLLTKDLQIDSPYNTYKINGLPPGPIASPGRASLQAAVNPSDVEYLFFVVFEDGEHVFSRTLAEHNRARNRYIKESFGD